MIRESELPHPELPVRDDDVERDELLSPTLVDESALQFWKSSFGDKNIVDNRDFREKLVKMLEKDWCDTEIQKLKVGLVVQRVFWPDHTLYKEHSADSIMAWVDTHSVQYAIYTFGPWKNIFSFINIQFQDAELVSPILNLFHGHSQIWKQRLNKSAKSYLVRYNDKLIQEKAKKGKVKIKGPLLICYTDTHGEIKQEKVFRKPPYRLGKGDLQPAGWTWTEIIPGIRRTDKKVRKAASFSQLLDTHKHHKMYEKAVMFGAAYESFGVHESQGGGSDVDEQKKNLQNEIDSYMIYDPDYDN